MKKLRQLRLLICNCRRAAPLSLMLALVVLSSACHRGRPTTSRQVPPPPPTPTTVQPTPPSRARAKPPVTTPPAIQGEQGLASWYGRPYHGRKTASGEIYNMYGISAAHRTLAFGTMVRVHDLDNGKDVDVRINDRGPFIEGRIIDLSYGAAKAIHLDIEGIARVKLEILGYNPEETSTTSSSSMPTSSTPPPGIFAVQVGAFRDRQNAERLKSRIEARYRPVVIQSFDRGDGMFHRVRVGQESTQEGAEELARKLRADQFATDTFVIRMN